MAELAAEVTDDRDRDEDSNNSKKRKMTEDESSSKNQKASERKKMPLSDSMAILKAISSRLPLFSVLRFLFVSKDWYSFLSSPDFLQKCALRFHSQGYDEPPGVLVCPTYETSIYKNPVYAILSPNQDPENPLKVRLDHVLQIFKKQFPRSYVIGSCNGLLLYQDRVIRVYNPMINQQKEIPPMDLSNTKFKNRNDVRRKGSPYLLFDPSVSLSFQILAIVYSSSSLFSEYEIHVYSSGNRKWRYISTITEDEEHNDEWKSVMLNGVFYFVRDDDVVCFDARDDGVSLVRLPNLPEGRFQREVLYMGQCRGRLLVMQEFDLDFYHGFPFHFSIIEMVEMPGQPRTWNEWYKINLEPNTWIERFRVNLDSYDRLLW